MILGLGLDVTELDRIRQSFERFGCRFAAKILTPEEQDEMPEAENGAVPFLAARFAAKEAAAKALGTGFAQGVTLHGMAVRSLPSGAPELMFSGRALEIAQAKGVLHAHISLTHGRDVAAAVVVLEGSPL
jgi:holo-[acyl-carrier protein] synthase